MGKEETMKSGLEEGRDLRVIEDEEKEALAIEAGKRAASSIVPTAKRLMVRAESASNPGSMLHIPEFMRAHCMTGVVVAAGAETAIGPGQRVILGLFTGVKFEVNGVAYLICKEDQIEGIVITDVEVVATSQ